MNKGSIVSLFDESGNALRPWASAGFPCYAFDIVNKNNTETFQSGGFIHYFYADLFNVQYWQLILNLNPRFMFSFSPCTDLAGSGNRHFERKRLANPHFQKEAAFLAQLVEWFCEFKQVPFMHENPVGVLAQFWRQWDYIFNPYEYGGYLPFDDKHPRWPEYIAPRDAYPKRTCIRSGNGFVMPAKLPVAVRPGWSDQQLKLGGKSAKTKQIRSEGPRGFLQAVFLHNCQFGYV